MKTVEAQEANFIKLGRGGEWEAKCLRDGTLRLGYHETPHELCLSGDWHGVQRFWQERSGNAGTAKRHMQQIRIFYEAGAETIFITFFGGLMYWCRPGGPVQQLEDGSKLRVTKDGWKSTSVAGVPLTADRLSGNLLKVQMFRGTICQVKTSKYLLRKLNDELLPEVEAAEAAERAHARALVAMMRLMTWHDFELLVDLVFSTSGWRRLGAVGRTQKTVDLELILPTTGERAFVQIKAKANTASLTEYSERFVEGAYDRMFFVWHTGQVDTEEAEDGISVVGPERLATMVLDAGLASWLREKVS